MAQTYLNFGLSENNFEQCGQDSDKAGLLRPIARALLLPLDVESRRGADKVGGTPSIGSEEGGCSMDGPVKIKGSADHESWKIEKNRSDSRGSKPAVQNSFCKFEFVNVFSLLD